MPIVFSTKTKPIIPIGEYILSVIEAKSTTTSKTNEEMVKITCSAYVNDGQLECLNVYDYFPITEKMAFKFCNFLKSIQRSLAEGESLDPTQKWLNENVLSTMGWAKIVHETYNGKPIAKIDGWLEIDKKHADPYAMWPQQEAPSEEIPPEGSYDDQQ